MVHSISHRSGTPMLSKIAIILIVSILTTMKTSPKTLFYNILTFSGIFHKLKQLRLDIVRGHFY